MPERTGIIYRGRAFKFGDNVDTDVIIPARYLNSADPRELARSLHGGHRPGVREEGEEGRHRRRRRKLRVRLFAGARPHRDKGERGLVRRRPSFARIFYRNAINIGFPILESTDASERDRGGDEIEVDLGSGRIANLTKGEVYTSEPFPEFMQKIIDAGGLVNRTKQELEGLGIMYRIAVIPGDGTGPEVVQRGYQGSQKGRSRPTRSASISRSSISAASGT